MSLSLEKVIDHYALIDRRVARGRVKLSRTLREMESVGPVTNLLHDFTQYAYLLIDGLCNTKAGAHEIHLKLNRVWNALENGPAQNSWHALQDISAGFNQSAWKKIRQSLAPTGEVDFDSFEKKILIGSLAFMNYCQLACQHCGNAENWDGRQHSLTDFESVLPKIRFAKLAPVTLSWHEPFSLPFLLDLVKVLLQQGASVNLLTSGLVFSADAAKKTLLSLQSLSSPTLPRVEVNLSFDLFKPLETSAYLAHLAGLLNACPIITGLNVSFSRENREETINALKKLSAEVYSVHGKNVIAAVFEEGELNQKEGNLEYVGRVLTAMEDPFQAVPFMFNHSGPTSYAPIAPPAIPFMLFAGGDIAPSCSFQAAHFKSLGNIFRDSPQEIYEKYLAFENKYFEFIKANQPAYSALILAEKSRRESLGIGNTFATHFDTLARAVYQKDKQRAQKLGWVDPAHFDRINGWVQNGLAAWSMIGIERETLLSFYRTYSAKVRNPALLE